MRKQVLFFLLIVLIATFSSNPIIAQNPVPKVDVPVYFDVSPPLIDMVPTTTPDETEALNEEMEKVEYPFYKYDGPDPVWQKEMGTVGVTDGLSRNFAGLDCLSNLSPSDDNGDIGPNHYVQTVNSKFQIFSRDGTSLYGPANINTLFTGVPGGTFNNGDPIVLYDGAANRWMISEFSTGGATKYMLIAVSTTADPLGTYYRWSYSWGTAVPDYPKFGIWRDSYLLGLNCSTDDVAAFDRSQMIAGNASPQVVKFNNPWFPASGWHIAQPCDNDGTFAPVGTPGLFILVNDDAWGGSDQLWLYSLTVNWASPGTATFTRINTLAVAAFDSNFGGTWDNIPQPGTAQKIEVLPNLLMYRAQYRNFGTYQSILCCHDVDVNGSDHAGIRWYELRNTGSGWTVYQQSTYAPDAHHRWMGSISQNGSGEIALGFTVASSTLYPSIRYTGRLSSDPLGTMSFAENTILNGTESQTDGNRWGDYTSMSIDPNDDKTFWYTSQYAGGSAWNWHTRIAAFKFDQTCTASGGCDEYISRVQLGTINNLSTCNGYTDYGYISTNLTVNATQTVTVTNGNPIYSGDQCGIWVDWNGDGDFADAGETMTVVGSPGVGPYTALITPPYGINSGPVKMRVRITYTGLVSPCGATQFGEVEDYSINVISYCDAGSTTCDEYISRVQLGTIDNSSGCTNYGNYLSLSTNFGLTATKTLTVTNGNLGWSADQCGVWIDWNRDLDFSDANETIAVSGSPGVGPYTAAITPPAGTAAGPTRMRVRITYNETPNPCGTASFGEVEDYTIILNGPNYWVGGYNNYWHQALNWSLGHIPLADEDVYITNAGYQPVYVDTYPGVPAEECKTLTIQSGGTLQVWGMTLNVNGNLTINTGGSLTMTNAAGIINLTGNWTESAGASGFTEGPGRVIFSGPAHQYIYGSENFNILEAKMGAALRLNNASYTVTCNQYDWTSGGIDVLAGTFTALDLADNGLFGTFWLNPGSAINLTQDLSQYTDLHGEIHNYGGTLTVTGGSGQSYWPYLDNGIIEMSSGVIDFENNGIYLYNGGNTFTENITGGTIKTNGSFTGSRTDFTPIGGTLELYGTSDAYLSHGVGSNFSNILINKSAAFNNSPLSNEEVFYDRHGKSIMPTRSNTVFVFSFPLVINGNLTIETGTLDLNAQTINVSGDVTINNATLKMINGADNLTATNIIWNTGSSDNINNGEIHVNFWTFNDGTNAMLEAPNKAYVKSGINTNDSDATFGNLVAVPLDIGKYEPRALYPLRITGDFTIQNGASWGSSVDVYVVGVFDIQNGATFYLWGTNTIYLNSPFQLNGILNIGAGNVLCHGEFSMASTGSLSINGGSFIADSPNHPDKGWEYLEGNLTMPAGLFEITHNSINFGSTATTDISGGVLRTGGAFYAAETGTFLPTGGIVEMIGAEPDIYIYCGNGNYFYNLLINKPAGYQSALNTYDILIKNDLTIQSGTLNSFLNNITIEGNWTNNVGTDGFVEGTNTVTFSGANPKDISTNETFNNLVINKTFVGTSGVEILSPLTVNVLGNLNLTQGTLQLDDNSTLNVSNDISFALNAGLNAISGPGINIGIGGNWTNNNTAAATTNAGFYGGTSTVTFNGSADQGVNTGFTSESFYNLNVNKSGGYFSPNDVLKIGGNIQILNGTWGEFTSGLAHELSGNIKIFALGAFYPKGNFTFTGNTNTTFENVGSNNHFLVNARVNKVSSANTLTLLSPVHLFNSGTLNVDKGTVNLNGNYFRVVGNVNINNGGKIAINSDAWLEIGSADALNVNSGGTLEVIGTAGHPAKVTHNGGYYTFNVNSGGTISANNATFEYTGTIDGLNVKSGAIINAANCFHNCTFRNGDPSVSNAALITIDNSQTFTVNSASFPAASTAKNVAKNVNSGHVTFYSATGAFAGATFEKDPYNLIDWYTPTLSAAPQVLNVNPPAGSTTFDITSNLAWTITESTSWFSVNPVSGSNNATITVTFDQNTSASSRTGNITISAAGVPDVVVAVNQAGATLAVAPSSQSVTAAAGNTTFNVTSNTSWSVAESISWFSVAPMSGTANGTLTVTCTQNTSVSPRSGQITVSSTGLPNVVVTVNQAGAGATLSVLPANRDVTPPASTTTFSLTSNTGWTVSESISWLSVLPVSGTGNGTLTVTYSENATGSTRIGGIVVTASGGAPTANVTVTQTSYPTQAISLLAGWSGLSSYIMPATTNLPTLFTPVGANFSILQNLTGIYYPAGSINTIGQWASQSAYSIKMNAASSLPVVGPAETNKTFALENGWNLLPVICNVNVTTSTLVGGLGANLTIIKEIAGSKVYWPAFGIYTLSQLTPGKAYFVRMAAAGSVTFPANAADNAFIPDEPVKALVTPWNNVTRTAGSHIIGIVTQALSNLNEGDIVGIFTPDDLCAGYIQIDNITENQSLFAFADDQLTVESDGFTDGQPMIFKLFRPSTSEEFNLDIVYSSQMPNDDGLFATEGISAISGLTLLNTGINNTFAKGLYIYPNPTNDKVTIGGITGIEQILVMSAESAVVMQVNPKTEGNQVLDLSGLPAGFYQIQIRTSQGVVTRKVVKGQ